MIQIYTILPDLTEYGSRRKTRMFPLCMSRILRKQMTTSGQMVVMSCTTDGKEGQQIQVQVNALN